MRSLYEIEVRVEDDVDETDHIEILVQPAVNIDNTHDFGSPAASELLAAGLHHAGLLGRLAASLTPWIDEERKQHGCANGGLDRWRGDSCPPSWFEACSLMAHGLISPMHEEACQPYLVFYIPARQREAWLTRISGSLAALAGAGT